MTAADVRRLIQHAVEEAGSQRKLARQWKVSTTFISLVLNGKKAPSGKVLRCLHVHREIQIHYEWDEGWAPPTPP